jgi:hypothetical protein
MNNIKQMTKNTKTLATILVVVIIAATLFLVYYFFLRPERSSLNAGLLRESVFGGGALDPITDYGSLSSQTGRELLFLLDDLRSISFDRGFIEGVGFNNLEDFSRELEPQVPGRENPFAPLQ